MSSWNYYQNLSYLKSVNVILIHLLCDHFFDIFSTCILNHSPGDKIGDGVSYNQRDFQC